MYLSTNIECNLIHLFIYFGNHLSVNSWNDTKRIHELLQSRFPFCYHGIISYTAQIIASDMPRRSLSGRQRAIANTRVFCAVSLALERIVECVFGFERNHKRYKWSKQIYTGRRNKDVWMEGARGEHLTAEQKVEGKKRWREAVDSLEEEDAVSALLLHSLLSTSPCTTTIEGIPVILSSILQISIDGTRIKYSPSPYGTNKPQTIVIGNMMEKVLFLLYLYCCYSILGSS